MVARSSNSLVVACLYRQARVVITVPFLSLRSPANKFPTIETIYLHICGLQNLLNHKFHNSGLVQFATPSTLLALKAPLYPPTLKKPYKPCEFISGPISLKAFWQPAAWTKIIVSACSLGAGLTVYYMALIFFNIFAWLNTVLQVCTIIQILFINAASN